MTAQDEEISFAICRSFFARKHVLPWRSSIFNVFRNNHTLASDNDHNASADDNCACRLRGWGSPRLPRGLFGSPPATDLITDETIAD